MAYNPYAPPTAPSSSIGNRDGAFAAIDGLALIVSKDAPLPDVCLKCAAPSTTRRRQQFVYTPPWVVFLMLLSLLIGAIVALIVQKRGTLQLPLCAECARKWKSANWQIGLAFLAFIVAIVIGAILSTSTNNPLTIILFLVLGLGAIIAVGIVNRDVRVASRKVDKTSITLIKVHPDAQRAILAALS